MAIQIDGYSNIRSTSYIRIKVIYKWVLSTDQIKLDLALLFYDYEYQIKIASSNFAFQTCQGFIGTKIEKKMKSSVSSLRKSQFSTLTN